MLRILVVDDEALAAERLVHLCGRLEHLDVVGVARDGRAALTAIEGLDPDVVLLDIAMPGLDGVALARVLAPRDRRPAVVFVTASSEFAVTAFELAATDYLLKPVSLERLQNALSRVDASRSRETAAIVYPTEIWVPRGRETTRVCVEALDLVEAERDYVRLHATGHVYLLRATLQDLERRLDPRRFVRVHRSTIVARDRISALRCDRSEGWTVLLSSGHSVRVGRSFRPLIRSLAAGGQQR